MSGLTGLELRMAYQSLISVKSFLKTITPTNEASATDDSQPQESLITFESDFEETLTKMLQMMRSKLDGPQILSFSGMSDEDLFKLNITYGGSLKLKKDYDVRVAATENLGKTEHWSSDGLYRHLCVLQKLVPRVLVLNLEHSVPPTIVKPFSFTTLGGYIDYTAISASVSDAEDFLAKPRLGILQDYDHTFFVSEAKTNNISLESHVPQAVCEMYACAKQLGKNFIRGTVTDGHNWIFLILRMNANGDGAIYAQSLQRTRLMTVVPLGDEEISRTMCDVIAGIITYWIEHSNEDIGDNDWFRTEWK
ncbi:hypothetical protein BYT27DRAFT_7219210 [Phlegmacium glaucopus]|nr:hypothetical protein BYT27DRAFT_7219210 [Phlegmacium glaucopus]